MADPRDETAAGEPVDDETAAAPEPVTAAAADEDEYDGDADIDEGGPGRRRGRRTGSGLSLPLVPVLSVLFVLLLGATAFLWFTRPSPSSVTTRDYAQVLEAARSGVVDLTSFDYLTLDDDIAQINRLATGDLKTQSVDQLNKSKKDLTDQQAVVNTQVVGAAVTRADSSHGTVILVIESTQKTKASSQSTVTRYRIQVELVKSGDRWLLSGIKGV